MNFVRIGVLVGMGALASIEPSLAGTPPTAVPGPIAGAGIPGLIAGGIALLAWYRRRK